MVCRRFGISFNDSNEIFDGEFDFETEIWWIAIKVELSISFRYGVENQNASKNPSLAKDHQKRMPKSISPSTFTVDA